MNFSVVETAVEYIYTGKLKLDWDLAQWMYSVGYTMGSTQLKTWSSRFMKKRCVV